MDHLSDILFKENSYILQSFIVVFSTLIVDYFQRKTLRQLYDRLQKTQSLWDDAVVGALIKPLTLIIWVAGISFAVDIIQQETGKAVIFEAIKPVRDTAIIGSLAWFLIRIIGRVENNILLSNQKIDRTTADAIAKLPPEKRTDRNIPCPFLEDDICSIYDARPIQCRGAHS